MKLKKPGPFFLFFFFNDEMLIKSIGLRQIAQIEFKKCRSVHFLRGHIPLRHPLSAPRGLTPFSIPSIIVLASGAGGDMMKANIYL